MHSAAVMPFARLAAVIASVVFVAALPACTEDDDAPRTRTTSAFVLAGDACPSYQDALRGRLGTGLPNADGGVCTQGTVVSGRLVREEAEQRCCAVPQIACTDANGQEASGRLLLDGFCPVSSNSGACPAAAELSPADLGFYLTCTRPIAVSEPAPTALVRCVYDVVVEGGCAD